MATRRHTMRTNERSEAPLNWVFFDTETLPTPLKTTRPTTIHRLRLGVAYGVRVQRGVRSCEQWCSFTDAPSFWSWLKSRLSRHRPTWVCAHNLPFDWAQVNGWKELEKHGLEGWKLVLADPPCFLCGKIDGCSVTFLDSVNYYRYSLAKLGQQLGFEKLPMPAFADGDEAWFAYCRRDVEVVAEGMLRLLAFHQGGDYGNFGKTVAQLAIHSYRHKFGPRVERSTRPGSYAARAGRPTETVTQIELHDNTDALMLERLAYFGGRVECNYVGRKDGPIYRLDINSLYPSIMRSVPLPRRLVGFYRDVPVSWLAERLKLYDGAAWVWLDSPDATYPYRHYATEWNAETGTYKRSWDKRLGKRIAPLYVRGGFSTALCGEELRRAVNAGHVWKVAQCSLYERALLFTDYVDHFYALKSEARERGDGWTEALAKSYLNSLAGVWGKRAPQWVSSPRVEPPAAWAKWVMADTIDGSARSFRSLANVCQEEIDDGECFDSAPIIAAVITAAARCQMRDLQACCGYHQWLYEDTDSVICTEAGLHSLIAGGSVHPTRIGALRLEAEAAHIEIRGVKDYQFGELRVIKGIRPDAVEVRPRVFRQTYWDGMHQQIMRRGRPEIHVVEKLVSLQDKYEKGTVGPDGWTEPIEMKGVLFDLF